MSASAVVHHIATVVSSVFGSPFAGHLNMSDPEQLRSRNLLRAQCVGGICSQAPLNLESFHCSEYVCQDNKELLEIAKILTVHHTTNSARLLCCQKIVGRF